MRPLVVRYVLISLSLLATLTWIAGLNGWLAAYAALWIALALHLLGAKSPLWIDLASAVVITALVVFSSVTLSGVSPPPFSLWDSAALVVVMEWFHRSYAFPDWSPLTR